MSSVCMYSSTRLQVERMTSSVTSGERKHPRASTRAVSENARRSRTATGAVVWFNPTTTIAMRLHSLVPEGFQGTHPRVSACIRGSQGMHKVRRQDNDEPTDSRLGSLGALPAQGPSPSQQQGIDEPRQEQRE